MFPNQQLGCERPQVEQKMKSGGARYLADSDDQRPRSRHHAMPFSIVTESKNADEVS
jgi:hypothetical protein